jgi:exopolysaccharide biosynthesis polyprenyl glycosylphosphotransferase
MSATPGTRPLDHAHLSPRERLGATTFVLPRNGRDWIVLGGRALIIWLPVYVLLAQSLPPTSALLTATLASAIWFLSLRAALNSYFTLGPAVASAVGTFTGLVVVSAMDRWVPGLELDAAGLATTAAAVFVLSTTWEHVVRSIAKRRVLVVGTNGSAAGVVAELGDRPSGPFELLGLVGDHADAGALAELGPLDELSRIIEAQRPDIVLLADDWASATAVDPLLDVAPIGFRVVNASHFFEHALGRVPLRHLTPAWFMSMLHLRQKPYTRFAKRAFDLILATVAGVLGVLLLPLLAVLVRTTRGPILYRQTRVGEGGRRFTMLKLRTMRVDAEDAGVPSFTQVGDARVTRAGRLLRQTHLDELPQVWNVLKGEMSIVGPRPERPEFVDLLEETVPFWTRRLLVKPGITGWAQLRCGYAFDAQSAAEKLSYDLWYLRNRNVVVDLAICAKTVSALLLRSGR